MPANKSTERHYGQVKQRHRGVKRRLKVAVEAQQRRKLQRKSLQVEDLFETILEQSTQLIETIERFLRFAGSSFVCTILDQVVAGILFVLLARYMKDMEFQRILIGTVVARCLSQTLSFILNRKLVFKPEGGKEDEVQRPKRESLPRFLAVAGLILSLSIVGVYALHALFGIQESIAKLMVDFALFFLNYQLQHRWVFRSEPSIHPKRAKRD